MRTSHRDEEKEKKEFGRVLSEKDFWFWDTIDRRNTFRGMRHTMNRLGIPLNIPMNLVDFSHKYCMIYGDPSIEKIQVAPAGWDPGRGQ